MKETTTGNIKQKDLRWCKDQTRDKYIVLVPGEVKGDDIKRCAIAIVKSILKYGKDDWKVSRKKTADKHYEQIWTGEEWRCEVALCRK